MKNNCPSNRDYQTPNQLEKQLFLVKPLFGLFDSELNRWIQYKPPKLLVTDPGMSVSEHPFKQIIFNMS